MNFWKCDSVTDQEDAKVTVRPFQRKRETVGVKPQGKVGLLEAAGNCCPDLKDPMSLERDR